MTVRGYRDLQADQLNTYAGTTSRWGQRIVAMCAVQRGWRMKSLDVQQAFFAARLSISCPR